MGKIPSEAHPVSGIELAGDRGDRKCVFCVIPTGVRGAEGPRIFLNARHFDAVKAYEAAMLRILYTAGR